MDQSTAKINKTVAVCEGGGEEVVNINRLRRDRFEDKIMKKKARAAIQRGDLKKSRGLVKKLEGDIANERLRFEDEKRVFVQQMARVRAEKDAEMDYLDIDLAELRRREDEWVHRKGHLTTMVEITQRQS